MIAHLALSLFLSQTPEQTPAQAAPEQPVAQTQPAPVSNEAIPLLEDMNGQLKQANEQQQAEQAERAQEQAQVRDRFNHLDLAQGDLTQTRDTLQYGTAGVAEGIDAVGRQLQAAPSDPAVAGSHAAASQGQAAVWLENAREALDNENGMAAQVALGIAESYLHEAQQRQ